MNEYKIFLGERFFLISKDEEKCFTSLNGMGTRITDYSDVNEMFNFFEQSDILEFYLYTESPEKVFNALISQNKFITAAGGVVFNEKNEILLIHRLGYWDLPKGKIEKGEEEIVAACREIEEECGIRNVKVSEKITDTYHVYCQNDKRVIKRTGWYNAYYNGNDALVPQTEEGITEVKWVTRESLIDYIPRMYASIREVINLI